MRMGGAALAHEIPSTGRRGCVAQNLQLQAAALGLASSVIGAFRDVEVACLLELPAREVRVCILPWAGLCRCS